MSSERLPNKADHIMLIKDSCLSEMLTVRSTRLTTATEHTFRMLSASLVTDSGNRVGPMLMDRRPRDASFGTDDNSTPL